ncbi:hypothetical protein BG011_009989 [Mortierella polycephala]|uniref:F-box domain-containing protein n=1 Tax=Mortierella polycephala TaxID=41804 RepID=A0A9P6PMH2_9FUNG|nr:hypothetical protein BG011_009989 [Mortierella polycephala]
MKSPLIQQKALQLPEIRRRISKFVAVTDAISCAQICKDWSEDFAFPIWYEVDFKVHETFEMLDPGVISKYGHHIRIVKNLKTQSLQRDVALFSGFLIDTFQHLRVTTLTASISQVFKPDPGSTSSTLGFSLLIHFPNLIHWQVYNLTATLSVPIEEIKAETRMCCPKLAIIDTWITPSPVLYGFLADAFRNLKFVTFSYREFSRDIILALLLHKATLIKISTFWDYDKQTTERDELPHEDDHFQNGRVMQFLPCSCPNLQTLALERHQMDIDHVEESEWACKQLRSLRVRIRGLDTEGKVDRALQLWLQERRKKNGMDKKKWKETKEDVANEFVSSQVSVEERVARHLLTFDKLEEVWLGTRTCYVSKTI